MVRWFWPRSCEISPRSVGDFPNEVSSDLSRKSDAAAGALLPPRVEAAEHRAVWQDLTTALCARAGPSGHQPEPQLVSVKLVYVCLLT